MSTAGAASSSGAIEELLQRWSEPHRAYHTTQHLQEAMDLLSTWCTGSSGSSRCASNWPSALARALFFHDAIYDPHRADNEEASAQLARSILGPLGVPGEMLSAVDRLIRVTLSFSKDDCTKCQEPIALCP